MIPLTSSGDVSICAANVVSHAATRIDVSDKANPYQPPTPTDHTASWWSRLVRFLSGTFLIGTTNPGQQRFADGDAIICSGIAYFVDPLDATRLYAASPSETNTDERMNLITAEAIRHLPALLAENPNLVDLLAGRKLCVRMIRSYDDSRAVYVREDSLDWDIFADPATDRSGESG